MPISSLIIRTENEKQRDVINHLQSYNEASVSEIHKDSLIVITETSSQKQDKSLWNEIEKIPGVLQCDLIYHNFEDEEGFKYD